MPPCRSQKEYTAHSAMHVHRLLCDNLSPEHNREHLPRVTTDWRVLGENDYLSVEYPSEFLDPVDTHLKYPTVEHYYLINKASVLGFEDRRSALEAAPGIVSLRQLSNAMEKRKAFDAAKWDKEKINVMRRALWFKFCRHGLLRQALLSTERRDIVITYHRSTDWSNNARLPHDLSWYLQHENAGDFALQWVGRPFADVSEGQAWRKAGDNLLGRCLMHVRAAFRARIPAVPGACPWGIDHRHGILAGYADLPDGEVVAYVEETFSDSDDDDANDEADDSDSDKADDSDGDEADDSDGDEADGSDSDDQSMEDIEDGENVQDGEGGSASA